MKRQEHIKIRDKSLQLPAFLPDATLGYVRAVDTQGLLAVNLQALVMNSFHLMQKPGSSTIRAFNGLHNFTGWPGLIITDSGGFQAYSLIHESTKFGSLTDNGIIFRPEGKNRKFILTPEKSIQQQISYDSDVIICLDDCTHVKSDRETQEISVKRTLNWAKRCKQEYLHQMSLRKMDEAHRPMIFGVIQGGGYPDLRRKCAEGLLEIGFDGFGYGGWPLDSNGNLLEEIVALTRELIPAEFPMHALGIGHPLNLMRTYQLGYAIFDCSLPTRDARHGRLMRFNVSADTQLTEDGRWMEYVYIQDKKYIKDNRPISQYCDCPICQNYSLGYLHHLFKTSDWLYQRMATLHNLRFMTQLTERLRDNDKK
ncbi:MAG: tRNA guanosine(34) transglycosylase Tgt [Chloroflexota bacterium]|nr:tRNA guanosine(34) transglycosylase Tgt [Chloroflexota bacterium]